ncbi:MAG: 30S ribosomal protein S16 [Bacteroidales bacterium]
MPTKIRLQRRGRKKRPFFHIVIADGRAPRDGRYIERIGTYDPLPQPAGINIDFERAMHWLQVGAQPTPTARAILSHKGVLYKNHLQKGVAKGALTQEQADAKYEAWLKEKEEKIERESKDISLKQKEEKKKMLEAERKINEKRAAEIAKLRKAELDEQAAEASSKAEEATEQTEQTQEKTSGEASQPTTEDAGQEQPAKEKPAEKPEASPEEKVEEPQAEQSKENAEGKKPAEEKPGEDKKA